MIELLVNIGWLVIALAVAISYVLTYRRQQTKLKILAGFEVFFSQGKACEGDEGRIDEWEKRLALFLKQTVGNRFHQRLLTAGSRQQSRVGLYLDCLDRFTAELSVSTFDGPVQYDEEADRLLESRYVAPRLPVLTSRKPAKQLNGSSRRLLEKKR